MPTFAEKFEAGKLLEQDINILQTLLAKCPALEEDAHAAPENLVAALNEAVTFDFNSFEDETTKDSLEGYVDDTYNALRNFLRVHMVRLQAEFDALGGAEE